MGKVHLLDPQTVMLVAAGEVIERPVSIVKELLENSLDAGASRIEVSLENGGLDLIRVVDNGCGLDCEDAVLAFQHHATSKISTVEDLTQVLTLGFRGEALPSIASVADVEFISRPPGASEGSRVILRAGQVAEVSTAICPPGTNVTVRGIFFNLPARLKFLKNPALETEMVSHLVQRIAIARPDCSIALNVNGRKTMETPGGGGLYDTIAAVYGLKITTALLPLGLEEGQVRITGFTSAPYLHRSRARDITLAINARYVRQQALHSVVLEAYKGLLPRGRYPISVIHIKIPPIFLDVNVHPNKYLVRFLAEKELLEQLLQALRQGLNTSNSVRHFAPNSSSHGLEARVRESNSTVDRPVNGSTETTNSGSLAGRDYQSGGKSAQAMALELAETQPRFGHSISSLPNQTARSLSSQGQGFPPLPTLKAIGQFRASYILAEGFDGLYLLDQHAAHERVRYEKLLKTAACGQTVSQYLAGPLPMVLTPNHFRLLEQHIVHLADLGVILEYFGGNSFLLRAVPSGLVSGQELKLMTDLLDLAEGCTEPAELTQGWLRAIACNGAVRANQMLSFEEMNQLLAELVECQSPLTCPHGRPAVFKLTVKEIEAHFYRY